MLAFDPSRDLDSNAQAMTASLADVKSGSITTAVRDTTIDGLEIHENDNLGMVDGKIVVSNPDMMETLNQHLKECLMKIVKLLLSILAKKVKRISSSRC